MAEDSRGKWSLSSGLTRAEQRVLVLLIAIIGVGVAYQQYSGGWRKDSLVLHRDQPGVVGSGQGPGPARGLPDARRSPAVSGAAVSGLLDINKATARELETLPGIGPVRAEAIVRSRQTQGPFRSLGELTRVPGIGDKTVEGIAHCLKPLDGATTPMPAPPPPSGEPGEAPPGQPTPAVSRPAKVNLNTATVEELSQLDGIGSVLARRIVEYRGTHGPFRRAVDIQKVSGIGPRTYEKNRDRIVVGPPGR